MYASGKSMREISRILKLDLGTVSDDIRLIRRQAQEEQAEYIEKELPFRHKLRTAAIDKALRELWTLCEKESSSRDKKAILDSIAEALIKQAAIDGDPMAIMEAIKAVTRLRKITGNIGYPQKAIEMQETD